MRSQTLSAVYFASVALAAGLPGTSGCIQEARLDPGKPCGENQTRCGDDCVDAFRDPSHCGLCGNACSGDEVCDLGRCGTTCSGGLTACDGVCVDTRFDPSHCGACNLTCESDLLCSLGTCNSSCTGGTTECAGLCVDTDLDPDNCGDCGIECATGMVCSAGVCDLECGGGTIRCDDICTNAAFDPAHCGDCETVCPGAANAAATCTNGMCGIDCTTNFGNCDGVDGNGCETDVTSTPEHCGDCADECPAVTNGTFGCQDSTCEVGSCDAGWGDCDTLLLNGCETRTQIDPAHCGGCNNPCGAGEFCVGGGCTTSVLFAADGRNGEIGNLYVVDPTTPELVPIAALGNPYHGLQWANDTLYGITRSGALFSINPVTGDETFIADVAAIEQSPGDLAFRSDGTLLACNWYNHLVAIDPGNGVGTPLADSTYCWDASGLAESSSGDIYNMTYHTLYTVSQTGQLNEVAVHNRYIRVKGATFHNGTLYALELVDPYGSMEVDLITVDTESAEVTVVGSLGPANLHAMASTTP